MRPGVIASDFRFKGFFVTPLASGSSEGGHGRRKRGVGLARREKLAKGDRRKSFNFGIALRLERGGPMWTRFSAAVGCTVAFDYG